MSGRAYILCVDDEQAVLNQLSAQLTRGFGSTHRVECAQSAEEALALIEEIHAAGDEVQVVICDQVMPGMKGDRFLEAVNRTRPEVMKILLTGQAGLDSAIYAINQAGLHRYVEKPWQPEDLNMTVGSLLTQFQLRRDLDRERARLTRRNRDLASLHQVGLGLGSAVDREGALALVAGAARSFSGARTAAVLAQFGSQPPRWTGATTDELAEDLRRSLEGSLARLRNERRTGLPGSLPEGVRAVAIQQGETLYGWILLVHPDEPSADTRELLEILAAQAAAGLSNLQLLEERLESERLSTIGRMISTIVHDFRNPMTAVKGYSGMFTEFELTPEKQRECARLIIEEADRMNLMIDEILEFSRGVRGRLRLAPTTVQELAVKVRRLMEPEFQGKGVAFRTELGYAGRVTLDEDRMKRAILNIASNALDAMGPGGVFTFASRLDDGSVEIDLSDTGRGIPEEIQARIFEPFFTWGKTRGIGLGMSIARKIVEEHGGAIRLESRPGQGTRFTLRLPLQPYS